VRIGIHLAGSAEDSQNAIDDLVAQTRRAKDAGVAAVWLAQLFTIDALTALAVVGREVPGIAVGTAVVPTYPRHPMMMASQALTTQAASRGQLSLGIGLSHQIVIEGLYGYSFEKPARHMREYLSVLMPLLHEGRVSFEGQTVKANTFAPLDVPGASPPSVLVAALAPLMLQITGEMADGTLTWMVGRRTLDGHIVPSITSSAEKAGRPAPRVVVALPTSVTSDSGKARETALEVFAMYGVLPSYRAMLDREGVEGPADVAVVGDEETVAAQLQAFIDAGATELACAVFGSAAEQARTLELVGTLNRESPNS
jgi:F420-dependent oxidoreductase-like protein